MNPRTETALTLVRESLARYTDTPVADMAMDTVLADIQIDSLTLAELLFELEDQLGTTIPEATEVPKQIGDIVALIEPYVADNGQRQVA